MKTDLTTIIITAIIGLVGGYFLCNMLLPQIQDVSFKTVNSNFSYTVADPDPEVFNYRALNPTVEVYVGNCQSFNANGECIDDLANAETETTTESTEGNQTNE